VTRTPTSSSDLNIIENLWRRVYAEGKLFGSIQELKFTIIQEWEELPWELLNSPNG